jgi:hypothetical protein
MTLVKKYLRLKIIFKFNFFQIIFTHFFLWSLQSYSAESKEKKIVCKEPILVQPTEEQLFEKYKKCTKFFIESEVGVLDKKSKKFTADIIQDIELNKSDYIKRLKFYFIKNLLSKEDFTPEKIVVEYISDYKKKKEFQINIRKQFYELLASSITEQIKIINPSFKESSRSKDDVFYLEEQFLNEFDKKIHELESAYKFKEIDNFLQMTLESLKKIDILSYLLMEVSYKAQGKYYSMNSFDKAIKLTDEVINTELKPPLSFYFDKIRILFWQGKYKECLDLKYPKNQISKDNHLYSSILKFRLFCEIESGITTVKEALLKIENQADIKKSPTSFLHLKSELLIADGQFDAAINLLQKSDINYNQFRAVDILVYKKKLNEALKVMYDLLSKDKDKDLVWQAERNMRLSLIYFLNKPNIKDYQKHFGYISKICDNLSGVMSKENDDFISSCTINRIIIANSSVNNIKIQLSQVSPIKQNKLFNHKTTYQFRGLL